MPIATLDEWDTVAGKSAEKDMLFVVEVYAKWCGPSDAVIQTVRRLQVEYAGRKLKFVQAPAYSHPRAMPCMSPHISSAIRVRLVGDRLVRRSCTPFACQHVG